MKTETRVLIEHFRSKRKKWPKRDYPNVRACGATVLRAMRSTDGRGVAAGIVDLYRPTTLKHAS